MVNENVIVHVTPGDCWEPAKTKNYFLPDSLKKNGYISCATEEQLLESAPFLYKDTLNQKILYIKPDKIKAQIVYEDIHQTGQTFPHIYGALNTDAIIKVVDFKPDESGQFVLPKLS
jgi:uncharacterized protein (DUF952 family)